MKKLFLLLILIYPMQAFAYGEHDNFQGLWPNFNVKDYGHIESQFSGSVIADINFDYQHNTTNRKDEYKDTRGTLRFAPRVKINKNLSLNGNFKLSRMSTAYEEERRNVLASGGGDRTFEETGIVVRELALNYTKDDLSLIAGKFAPNFGTAWRWGRGIWSQDIAENYRQVEKLGVGTIYKMGDRNTIGGYSFGLSVFTNDRKNLDNSLLERRDSDRKSDAKVGDTRSPESFVASMDVDFDFPGKEELSYHFSYLNLAANEKHSQVTPTKIDDQKAISLGGKYRYPVNDNLLIDGLLEYTDMKNVGGDSDVTEKYYNASIVGEFYQNWNITVANTYLKATEIDQNGLDQNLSEVSFGYKIPKNRFFDQFLIQIGYKNLRSNYKTSIMEVNSYGILARYVKLF